MRDEDNCMLNKEVGLLEISLIFSICGPELSDD